MSQEIPTQLSTVTESLPPVAKVRYIEKLRLCNLPACPYGIPDYLFKRGLSQVEAVVPQMSPHDIYVYLIFGLSTLSEESRSPQFMRDSSRRGFVLIFFLGGGSRNLPITLYNDNRY